MTQSTAEKLVALGIPAAVALQIEADILTQNDDVSTSTSLTENSDTKIASQKAVKAYVDGSTVVHQTGAETIAGVKTFTSMPVIPVNTPLAGAGTTVTDAAQLSAGFTVITGANGTVGWKLPATPAAGTVVIIKGTTSGVAKIWPDAAATINAIGSNGAFSLASGVIPAIFIASSSTQWYSIPLVPS